MYMIPVFGGICTAHVCLLENSLPLSTIWYVIKLISKSIFFMETMVVILYYDMYKNYKKYLYMLF